MKTVNVDLNRLYLDYLISRFCHSNFSLLLSTIHRIDFYWVVPNDENRANDAYDLRREFYEIFKSDMWPYLPSSEGGAVNMPSFDECFTGSCSTLEVMCALCARFERDVMYDDTVGNRETKWFCNMLAEAGFTKFDNRHFTDDAAISVVSKIHDILDRKYKPNGDGGFFPLTSPDCKDQTKVELWYQIAEYYNERYVA